MENQHREEARGVAGARPERPHHVQRADGVPRERRAGARRRCGEADSRVGRLQQQPRGPDRVRAGPPVHAGLQRPFRGAEVGRARVLQVRRGVVDELRLRAGADPHRRDDEHGEPERGSGRGEDVLLPQRLREGHGQVQVGEEEQRRLRAGRQRR